MKPFLKNVIALTLLFALIASVTSCRARDCKGRKKTVKTAMGGWL